MKPVYISIKQEATGNNIRSLMEKSGFTVHQVQEAMGFNNPQAIYKWLNGEALPNIKHLMVLGGLFKVSAHEILVVDGDLFLFYEETVFRKRNIFYAMAF